MIWSKRDSDNLDKLVMIFQGILIAVEKLANIDTTKNEILYNEYKEDKTKEVEYIESNYEKEHEEEKEEELRDIKAKMHRDEKDINKSFFEEDDLELESLETISDN